MSKREIDLSSSEPDEASDEDEYVEHNRSRKVRRVYTSDYVQGTRLIESR